MYLLSVKNIEGAPNQDLQNLECSAYGLCRTDFHQNLQYCTQDKTIQLVDIQFETNKIGAGNFWKFLSEGSQQQTVSTGQRR